MRVEVLIGKAYMITKLSYSYRLQHACVTQLTEDKILRELQGSLKDLKHNFWFWNTPRIKTKALAFSPLDLMHRTKYGLDSSRISMSLFNESLNETKKVITNTNLSQKYRKLHLRYSNFPPDPRVKHGQRFLYYLTDHYQISKKKFKIPGDTE